MSALKLLHFNDVYRVTKQKVPGGTIDVTQFAAMLENQRSQWADLPNGKKDGLVLFSGDVFSPSVESSVTRGSHMVPVMNALAPDVAVTGNHDFDFGYPHLTKLIKESSYPWLLSNIIDTTTNQIPEHLKSFEVFERAGVRVGVIGLVEKEWITTVSSWPATFQYRNMKDVALELSRLLRDPDGEHKCDLIVALTHARVPNDIQLAKELAARPSPDPAQHGVDLVLGGHDHFYFVSKGVAAWDGYEIGSESLGAEQDDGVYVIKSGTDFRDLSHVELVLDDTPAGSVRRKIIKEIKGKRWATTPGSESSESLGELLKGLLSSVSASLSGPVCKTKVQLNVKSELVRTKESASGNWFADVLRHAYDEALCIKTGGGADGVLICGGTLRGDSVYGPGELTLGDIMEILPFEDPIVVLEMDGEALWGALEGALETWPAQEGRFPIVSGFRVIWDSSRPKRQRVASICLALSPKDGDHDEPHKGESASLDGAPVERQKGGRVYKVVTRQYMAEGHDGYDALKGCKYLIDDENGKLMSALVRQYLLGCQYINKLKALESIADYSFLDARTSKIIDGERQRYSSGRQQHGIARWRQIVVEKVLSRSKKQIREAFSVSGREHMAGVDCHNGTATRGAGMHAITEEERKTLDEKTEAEARKDLVTIEPIVDGRMKDIARE